MRAPRDRKIERPLAPVVDDVLPLVGNTPLIRIRRISASLPAGVEVYAKAEFANPGGSVKDRPALRMIEQGELSGALTPDKIVLDATSGNTGIALAMVGAVRGYRVELAMPSNVSEERKIILKAYGAKIHWSDPLEGSDGAIRLANEIEAASPDKYFRPNQYNNPENWRAHYHSTGPEIWAQTEGRVTHFVTSMGTSGTLMGTGRYLRERNDGIEIVALEPEPFHGVEGLKNMSVSIVPGIYDAKVYHRKIVIGTEAAYDMTRRLAAEEGILVGQSSGANLVGALEVARTLREGVVVTIFCDGGDKYLSTAVWNEAQA